MTSTLPTHAQTASAVTGRVTHTPCGGARAALEESGIFGVNGSGRLVLINNPGAYPAAWRCVDCGAEFWQQFAGAPLERM
jgi:hypothetical protein